MGKGGIFFNYERYAHSDRPTVLEGAKERH
jgi:hypothetical protein